jgi:periplasmic divalent cation tolerance protein
MADDNAPILIYTTLETADDAKKLGRALVETRLAACVNILAPMTAICEWKGDLDENPETPMLIKSRRGLQEKLLAEARRLHPYEVPALLVIEPSAGDADFCRWIVEQTTPAA